ncbi:alcohol dehydrogenase catalytic domain-containing protein [Paraburkholderia sp. Se-20369]|nr:alcohol dehydrogenase catalytic domain-containing protein [Paraburkholderia sp. Se-20369]
MRAGVHDCHSPQLTLTLRELPDPSPGPGQLLIDILACGVCRTDLQVVDGDLRTPKRPVIPGRRSRT